MVYFHPPRLLNRSEDALVVVIVCCIHLWSCLLYLSRDRSRDRTRELYVVLEWRGSTLLNQPLSMTAWQRRVRSSLSAVANRFASR